MKKIIVIAVFMLLGIWGVRAEMSDWFFCQIRKDDVVISLKKTEWFYKCNDTLASLEQLMINTAKDLMKIQSYLNKGRNVEYRNTIKTEKQALLKKIQLSRTTLIANIKMFESTLLQKSVQYFIIKITPYKISLQKSLIKIQTLTLSGFITPELDSYALLLKTQVATIDALSKVTTQAELIDLLKKYVYLKKEILWRYE